MSVTHTHTRSWKNLQLMSQRCTSFCAWVFCLSGSHLSGGAVVGIPLTDFLSPATSPSFGNGDDNG